MFYNEFVFACTILVVRLSTDPKLLFEEGSGGGLSHSVELDSLQPNATHETELFLRVNGETELRLISKVKYIDKNGQPIGSDCITPVTVIAPFALTTNLTDTHGASLASIDLLQPFVLNHRITNVSSTSIVLSSVALKVVNVRIQFKLVY